MAFTRAQALDPCDPEVARAAATLADSLKFPARALHFLQAVVDAGSADTDLLAMVASLHLELGAPEVAREICDGVLSRQRSHRDALMNRGMALRAVGDVAGAIENDCRLARAYIGSASAQLNYADACLMGGRYADALSAIGRALSLAPDLIGAHRVRGLALAMLGRFDEANAEFAYLQDQYDTVDDGDREKNIDRALFDALTIYIAHSMERWSLCDWSVQLPLLVVLRQYFSNGHRRRLMEKTIAFNVLSLPLTSSEQRNIAVAVARFIQEQAPVRTIPLAKTRSGRLRVAYLSADFRRHPVAECLWRVFPLHDRSRFEVFAYSLTANDGSPMRACIEADAEHFADISLLSDREAVERIALDQIHVLVDCSGYTEHTRPQLLAARIAPVQAQILGAPGPCGGSFVDYRITDAFATPPSTTSDWDEALAWLPDTLFLCDDTLNVQPPPSRAACGLPDDAFVFCCFNNHYKIDPDVFSIWMRLLKLLPNSVLWLVEGQKESMARLWNEAKKCGVENARLIFAPFLPLPQHLARHACADLFLDTFYYNAGTTAVYALRAGLPVLTCAGQTTVARMGGSVVRAAGLPELVVESPRDYEVMALRLATLPNQLSDLRCRLRAEGPTSRLFDMPGRVRALERAYEAMWQRAEHGKVPESFVVPAESN